MKKKILLVFMVLILGILAFGMISVSAEMYAVETDGIYTYTVSDGKAEITACDSSASGAITIPSTLGGYPVTSIGDDVFFECRSLTSVIIPDSITQIGYAAFYSCSGLTSITIPDSVTNIGFGAFYGCSGLTKVNITSIEAWCKIDFDGRYANPIYYAENLYLNGELVAELVIPDGVTNIGNEAFYGCRSLTSITIPDSVTQIGDDAFSSCISLTSITIPDSVTSIGSGAFSYCSSLTSITIPEGVTYIDSYTFSSCKNLTDIIIPDSVTGIGERAFSWCKSLTSVTIPDSVTSIGYCAFVNCADIQKVYYKGSVAQWDKILFEDGNHALTNAEIIYNVKKTYKFETNCGVVLPKDSQVILACYNDGRFTEMSFASNKNETIYFVITNDFDTAKVMVWDSFGTMKPLCEAEVVQ